MLSVTFKIFCSIILQRMTAALDTGLRREQHGFRAGRSCVDLINTVRIIIEQSAEYQSPLWLLFIDFEKAFDSVNRENIWAILYNRGTPRKIVNLIKEGYRGYKCRVKQGTKLSEEFETKTGVKQGCILSPLLFAITLDEIMRNAIKGNKRGIGWTLNESLEDLEFADDICLLSHRKSHLQQKVTDVQIQARKVGLKINGSKTKAMAINIRGATNITVDEENIEMVEEFTYLGATVARENGVQRDVVKRIGKARSVFVRLNKTWRTRNIREDTKIKIFKSMVKPVLLYGSESWTITEETRKKLQVFINRCLRSILGIFWPETMTNEELWKRAKEEKIEIQIRRRKLRWIGHTLRKEKEEIPRRVLQWNPQGTRGRGRPCETWRRSIYKETNMTWRQMGTIAHNRQEWKQLVSTLCPEKE